MIRFITEYTSSNGTYGYFIDALDFEHAQQQCDARRPGEVVKGVLYSIVVGKNFSHHQASNMCQAFADCDDGFPPPASEFPPINGMGEFEFAEMGGYIEGVDDETDQSN